MKKILAIFAGLLLCVSVFGQVKSSGWTTTTNPGTALGALGGQFAISYTIKRPGQFSDGIRTFTNLQACFNVISNLAGQSTRFYTNSGMTFIDPPLSFCVNLDYDAYCYAPGGFQAWEGVSSFIKLEGQYTSRIVGDSNVLTMIGYSSNGLMKGCADIDIGYITFAAKNPTAKTVMIAVQDRQLNFHDNFVIPEQLITTTNNVPLYYLVNGSLTVPPGLIGLYSDGIYAQQHIRDNIFQGLAVSLMMPHEHALVEGNTFFENGIFRTNSVNTNGTAWSAADVGPISYFGETIFNGYEVAVGAEIMLAGTGDHIIFGNHGQGNIYQSASETAGLGIDKIFYNLFEGAPGLTFGLIRNISRADFVSNPTSDYFGNGTQSGQAQTYQSVSTVDFSGVLTVSNFVLSGFSDSTVNGQWRLKTNSMALTAANIGAVFIIWTNTARLNEAIFFDPNGSLPGFMEVSNSVDGDAAYAASFNIPPGSPTSTDWFPVGGSGMVGITTWGTNNGANIKPTVLVTNYSVFDDCTRINSNGTTFFIQGKPLVGNGGGLTNILGNSFQNNTVAFATNTTPAWVTNTVVQNGNGISTGASQWTSPYAFGHLYLNANINLNNTQTSDILIVSNLTSHVDASVSSSCSPLTGLAESFPVTCVLPVSNGDTVLVTNIGPAVISIVRNRFEQR